MRHDDILSRDRAFLLIIDVQERLLNEIVHAEKVVANTVKIATAARTLGLPIVVTEHNPRIFGPTPTPIRDAVAEFNPISKMIFSCFGVEEFVRRMDDIGRNQIIVAGLETHICVCQTALDAVIDDYEPHILHDAVSARSEENNTIGWEKMMTGGAIPCSVEIAIFDLLERAGTDEFRKILPLLK